MRKIASRSTVKMTLWAFLVVGLLLGAKVAGWGNMRASSNSINDNEGAVTDATCPTNPTCDASVRSLRVSGGNPAIVGETTAFSGGIGVHGVGRASSSFGGTSTGVLGEAPGTGVVGRGVTGVIGESTSSGGNG